MKCPECDGKGEVVDAPSGSGRAYWETCPVCHGTGQVPACGRLVSFGVFCVLPLGHEGPCETQ